MVNYSSEVCRVDARKYFFSETVIAPWNSLPAKDEHVTAVNSFRAFSKSSEVLSSSVVFCSYCTLVSDCLWFYHGSCNCLVLWLVPTFSVWFTVYFTHWQINLIWFDWSYDAVSTAWLVVCPWRQFWSSPRPFDSRACLSQSSRYISSHRSFWSDTWRIWTLLL